MKKITRSITYRVFNSSFLKNKLFSFVLTYLKENKNDFNYFIQEYINLYPKDVEKFSSQYNNGYKHIEDAMALASFLKLSQTGSIVDVGGAGGYVALMFAKKNSSSRIYSFEPIPSTYKLLLENTKTTPSIIPVNKGLGSMPGDADIHVAQRFTSSSLFPIEKEIENSYFSENLKETRTELITISTLDQEIPATEKINILKIDVQGYELEVLKGGKETLKRTSIIVLELMNHSMYTSAPMYYELDQFLREHDFTLYNLIPSILQDNKLYEWDAIYVNKKLLVK